MSQSLRRVLALLFAFALVAAACGDSDSGGEAAPTEDTQAAPTTAAAAEEKTLVVAAVDTAPTLDTEFFTGTPQSWEMTDNIYDTKFWYSDDGVTRDFNNILPRQFESFEVSDDGTVWTFVMRDDLIDENGDRATTEDWIYGIERGFEVQAVTAFLLLLMNVTRLDQFEVIDDRTFTMTLDAFSPLVLPLFSLSFIPIMNKDIVESHATADDPWSLNWLATNTAGFGPYYLEENTAGQQMVLRANPNYWGGKPDIDRIIYRAVPESSNRVAVLLSGDADMALALSGTELTEIAANDNIELSVFESNNIATIIPNIAVPPFDNPMVRQALALCDAL